MVQKCKGGMDTTQPQPPAPDQPQARQVACFTGVVLKRRERNSSPRDHPPTPQAQAQAQAKGSRRAYYVLRINIIIYARKLRSTRAQALAQVMSSAGR